MPDKQKESNEEINKESSEDSKLEIVLDDVQESEEIEIDVNTGEEIKEEEENGHDEKQSESKTSEDKSEEEKEEEVESPTFDDVEKDENKLKKYNKNEQALYWKWKSDRHKRQSAQKEKEELNAQYELDKVKFSVNKGKLKKLEEELKAGKELTAEQLLSIINDGKKEEEVESKEVKVPDVKAKVQIKAQFAEKIGSAKYEKFQEIAALAKEFMAEDKSGTYQKLIDESFIDDSVDENTLVERIVSIAKLSPKFNSLTKSASAEDTDKAKKVLNNASKKVSSAAVGKSSGKRVITEDELTPDDAARLSTKEWMKLSDKTRKRILMGTTS